MLYYSASSFLFDITPNNSPSVSAYCIQHCFPAFSAGGFALGFCAPNNFPLLSLFSLLLLFFSAFFLFFFFSFFSSIFFYFPSVLLVHFIAVTMGYVCFTWNVKVVTDVAVPSPPRMSTGSIFPRPCWSLAHSSSSRNGCLSPWPSRLSWAP